jgi:hypothetical protein
MKRNRVKTESQKKKLTLERVSEERWKSTRRNGTWAERMKGREMWWPGRRKEGVVSHWPSNAAERPERPSRTNIYCTQQGSH